MSINFESKIAFLKVKKKKKRTWSTLQFSRHRYVGGIQCRRGPYLSITCPNCCFNLSIKKIWCFVKFFLAIHKIINQTKKSQSEFAITYILLLNICSQKQKQKKKVERGWFLIPKYTKKNEGWIGLKVLINVRGKTLKVWTWDLSSIFLKII